MRVTRTCWHFGCYTVEAAEYLLVLAQAGNVEVSTRTYHTYLARDIIMDNVLSVMCLPSMTPIIRQVVNKHAAAARY